MIRLDNREIGPDHRPFIIAEIAQTHEGSLGNCFAFAEVARDCGADAIKFQTHIAAEESTPHEPWRIPFSKQDGSRYDYWRRMEFTFEQWRALKLHCDALGIVFMSSPFSVKACEWLHALDMKLWKIASGEIGNLQLLDWIADTGQPMILSTGLATPEEAISAVSRLKERGNDVALLHCTTRYPTPADAVGLNVLSDFLRKLPAIPVGLSDHSGTPHPGVIACYLGASIVEVHLTLHEKMFGPDVSSSLTPDKLSLLVQGAEMAWRMRAAAVDKHAQIAALGKERSIFGRSLFTNRPITRGEIIGADAIGYKKPAGGLTFAERELLIGRTAASDLPADHMLKHDDVA
jgi:N-acetylneuraminate synthase